eukprot:55096-Chlamydomonas_euryale.AAC.1
MPNAMLSNANPSPCATAKDERRSKKKAVQPICRCVQMPMIHMQLPSGARPRPRQLAGGTRCEGAK